VRRGYINAWGLGLSAFGFRLSEVEMTVVKKLAMEGYIKVGLNLKYAAVR